jgi:hypothetical protein
MDPIGAPGLKPHRGGMLLAFGILAWVMGNGDLKEMADGRMDPSGEGMTKAGKILGMIGCILHIVGFLGWLLLVIFGVALAGLHGALR